MKNFLYEANIKPKEIIKSVSNKIRTLEKINNKYKVIGEYQNHSNFHSKGEYVTPYVGAGLYDIYTIFEKMDPQWTGIQFDIGHAVVEGNFVWQWYLDLLLPYITSIHVKDHEISKSDEISFVKMKPLGDGIVNFKLFFEKLTKLDKKLCITMYYGYDIGDKVRGIDKQSMEYGLNNLRSYIMSS
jgi:sugar phosphate isomerase/epimerase